MQFLALASLTSRLKRRAPARSLPFTTNPDGVRSLLSQVRPLFPIFVARAWDSEKTLSVPDYVAKPHWPLIRPLIPFNFRPTTYRCSQPRNYSKR